MNALFEGGVMKRSSQFRKITNLSESVQQQFNMYAIAAVVAVAEMVVLAQPLAAKIVYTPTNIQVGTRPYNLDLNHDGLTDFSLYQVQSIFHYCHEGPLTEDWLREAAVQGNGVVVSASSYAAALRRGIKIGSNQTFVSDWRDLAFVEGGWVFGQTRCAYAHKLEGDWANVSNRYLGVEFRIKGKTHYGWARLSVQVGYVYIHATLTGYAYETIAGKAIIAGRRKGTDDTDVEEPTASLTSPPHTPATLGMSALGVPTLAICDAKSC